MIFQQLTLPTNTYQHGTAYQVYDFQGWVNGKYGIPKHKRLVKGKFSAEQQSNPSTDILR